MATQIDHPFEVQATWGKLSGKPGDFLLKNFSDRKTTYPDELWNVDQRLFQQTYVTVLPRSRRQCKDRSGNIKLSLLFRP